MNKLKYPTDNFVQSLDPDEREWEYTGAGDKVYKDTFEPYPKEEAKPWRGVEEPYYVDLP